VSVDSREKEHDQGDDDDGEPRALDELRDDNDDERDARREVYRGTSYVVDFTLKIELFIVVGDAAVPRILAVLEELLGARNDWSVLVSDIVDAVRIRTGERGQEAADCPGRTLSEN
jgi:hypothetical protein